MCVVLSLRQRSIPVEHESGHFPESRVHPPYARNAVLEFVQSIPQVDGIVPRPIVPFLVNQMQLLPARVVYSVPLDMYETRMGELEMVRYDRVVIVPFALREIPVSVVPDSEKLGILRRDDDAVIEPSRSAVVFKSQRGVVDSKLVERPRNKTIVHY